MMGMSLQNYHLLAKVYTKDVSKMLFTFRVARVFKIFDKNIHRRLRYGVYAVILFESLYQRDLPDK